MKTKLIILDTPVIVSDEEIADVRDVKGKWHIEKGYIINQFPDYLTDLSECKLIIAGIEGLPSIDWNGLEEEFGWIDVEKLAKELDKTKYRNFRREHTLKETYEGIEDGFIEGFKKAQSLNENKFSLEDMFKCFQAGIDYEKEGSILQPDAHGYIQLLQQPKVFDIEIDGDWNKEFYELDNKKNVPKVWKPRITNNSIKILKKL